MDTNKMNTPNDLLISPRASFGKASRAAVPRMAFRALSICLLMGLPILLAGCGGEGASAPDEAAKPGAIQPGAIQPGAIPEAIPVPLSPANSDYDPVAARRLAVEAAAALQEGDLETAHDRLRQALVHRPAYFEAWRLLAIVEEARGEREAALEAVRRAASSGVLAGLDRDPRLEPLRQTEELSALVAGIDLTPLARAVAIARLSTKDLVTEDVAYDPRSGAYYISSVRRRQVLRLLGEEVTTVFPPQATGAGAENGGFDPNLWAVLGMALDADRGLLWLTTGALPQMLDYDAELEGKSALIALEVAAEITPGSGGDSPTPLSVAQRYDFGTQESPVAFNDVAVAADGTVFVTDNRPPGAIYHLRPWDTEPRLFVGREAGGLELRSPQGLAVDVHGRLWIADYSYGIAVVDSQTGKGTWVSEPDDTCLLGIDGLAYDSASSSLIAIQNVLPPNRILRLRPSPDARAIATVEVLERAHPDWQEPTLGTVVDDAFVYIGRSQWNRFDREGQLPPLDELEEPLILRLPLGG